MDEFQHGVGRRNCTAGSPCCLVHCRCNVGMIAAADCWYVSIAVAMPRRGQGETIVAPRILGILGATATVAALMLGGALFTFHRGPTYAVAPTHMRAIAAALLLFRRSFVSFALGPRAVGQLSDVLRDDHGIDSLLIASPLAPVLSSWAALHCYVAARSLRTGTYDLGNEPAVEAIRG